MPDHARQHQAAFGNDAHFLEVAAMKLRVRENRLTRDFVEGDVLRRQLWRRGDRQAVADALGVGDRPLERLHAAEAAANDCCPLLDAELIGQARLAVDPVLHRDDREVRAVDLAGGRVQAAGPGRAVAAAEVVQADDEKAFGIDRFARADAAVPPARLAIVHAVVAGRVVMAGQRVADQHRIAAAGVELAVGFVDQLVIGQRAAAGERQRFGEMRDLRAHQANGIGWNGSGHRPWLLQTEGRRV